MHSDFTRLHFSTAARQNNVEKAGVAVSMRENLLPRHTGGVQERKVAHE
jgi:hypothetical protein